jgi:hypothetical protein
VGEGIRLTASKTVSDIEVLLIRVEDDATGSGALRGSTRDEARNDLGLVDGHAGSRVANLVNDNLIRDFADNYVVGGLISI